MRFLAVIEEAQAIERFLRDQHCDEGQGYLYSRPVLADEFVALLSPKDG